VFTGGLVRVAGENVGAYAINQGTLSAGANYTISYTGNNLTITPYLLTVTATAQSKIYGAADPALTYTNALCRTAIPMPCLPAASPASLARTSAPMPSTRARSRRRELHDQLHRQQPDHHAYSLTVTANAQSKVYGAADPR